LTVETVVTYQFLLVEGVRRNLSLVAKTQYCAVVVSRGGWYQVTVSLLPPLPLQPTRSAGDWARMSFAVLSRAKDIYMYCVMRPVLTAASRICSDAHTIEADTILSIRCTQYRYPITYGLMETSSVGAPTM